MDGKHPKRRKDKYNPYSIMQRDGAFFLSFKDGEGILHSIEVDKLLHDLFNIFELEDLSYLNVWDRHVEQSKQTDETLNKRALNKASSVEDTAIELYQIDLLHKAILELPDIQRRRVILYYFSELTYEQIAEIEGCTKVPVKRSIDRALAALRKKLSK